jgi:hypothetical protein
MATRNATVDYEVSERWHARLVRWSGLTFTTLDDGAPAQWVEFADRCFQVTGTFGAGGSLVIEGSNDGTTWHALSDPQGNPLTFTTGRIEQALELPRFVRPRVTAGDATTNLTVTLMMRRVQ